MNASPDKTTYERRQVARAEASVWIVRLHGPNRTPELEAGFKRWLAAHAENAEEFERVTGVWEAAPEVAAAGLPRVKRWHHPNLSLRWVFAAAALVTVGVGVWLTVIRWHGSDLITGIGEQRLIPLEDGSRLTLNSDSHVQVDFRSAQRRVRLIRGEAFFEVTHDPQRPFVVIAGAQQVTAVGTAFEVRYEPTYVDVMLVEGRVSVTSNDEPAPVFSRDTAPSPTSTRKEVAQAYLLVPGERRRFAKGRPSKLDEPRVEEVTAWRRGEVMFDDTPLSAAVAEMNRYNKSLLVLDEAQISSLRVSGIYHTGDSEGFAATVANLYGLRVTESGHAFHLTSIKRSR